MKTIKKLTSIFLAALLGTVLLSGCGKIGGGDEGDILTIGVSNNTSEVNIINTFRTAYMKENPGAKIKIVRIQGSFDNALVKLIRSKDMPDVVQVYDFSAKYWTNAGLYCSIGDYMERDGISEEDYFDSVIEMAKSGTDGRMYWAPRDYNKVTVCFNPAVFEAAGIRPGDDLYPKDDWTWTEFTEICRALKAKTADILRATGQQIFYPVDMNLNWEAVYYPAIRSYGGDFYDVADGSVTGLKAPDKIKQGFDTLLSLADEGLAVEPTQTGTPFPSRQCAMMFTVRPNVVSYANSLKDADGNATIDFVSMPSFDKTEISYIGMGCTGYAITSQCAEEKRDMAWDFLKFVMTETGQNAFCSSGAGIPILKEMAADPQAAFRQYLPGANHDAFINFEGRDLPMTEYLDEVNASKHLAVRSVLVDNLSKNLFSSADRNGYYAQLKEMLENAIR